MFNLKINLKLDKAMFNEPYLTYLFDYSHRIEVQKGSAGSGKSVAVTQKAIIKALNDQRKVLFVRKVGTSIKDSTWQLTLDILSQFNLKQGEHYTANKSDFTITFKTGSTFLFKGLDDSEKIKSIVGLTDIIIEEATELTADDFTQLLLRLRANKPDCQCFLMFNPVSKLNWVYSYFKFSAENQCDHIREYDDIIIFSTTYKDNKFLPIDYIETLEAMKETNPYYYQVYVLGKFGSLEKLIFNNWKVQKLDVDNLLINNELIVCSGLDAGFNHPYAAVISLVDKENKLIYVIDEYSRSGKLAEDVYSWICDQGYGSNHFIMDAAAAGEIARFKKMGLDVDGAKKKLFPVLVGLTNIMNYKIIIDESCTNFIAEIMGYSWKKDKNGIYYEEPVKEFDDLMDAFRYSLEPIWRPKRKPIILTQRL